MLIVQPVRNALQPVQFLATRVHLLPPNQQRANHVLKEVTRRRVPHRALPVVRAIHALQLQNIYALPDRIPSLEQLSAHHAMKGSTPPEVLLSARIAKPASIAQKGSRCSARAGSGQWPKYQAARAAERGIFAHPLRRRYAGMVVTRLRSRQPAPLVRQDMLAREASRQLALAARTLIQPHQLVRIAPLATAAH